MVEQTFHEYYDGTTTIKVNRNNWKKARKYLKNNLSKIIDDAIKEEMKKIELTGVDELVFKKELEIENKKHLIKMTKKEIEKLQQDILDIKSAEKLEVHEWT